MEESAGPNSRTVGQCLRKKVSVTPEWGHGYLHVGQPDNLIIGCVWNEAAVELLGLVLNSAYILGCQVRLPHSNGEMMSTKLMMPSDPRVVC